MSETLEKNRKIMSWSAIGVGLLMVSIIPFIVQTSLERVLVGLIEHVEAGNPAFASGIPPPFLPCLPSAACSCSCRTLAGSKGFPCRYSSP